ncbi:class II fumarate hydratase [Clostridium sp. HV4-5-A1G]|jgi:fumarate hydratase class II|uniref:class II fumarate hydratase n=1 Tax=Clostridium sp. HV4-5-A1G TaxID=2004595 RepID=UPI00123A6593|nr:class II fumarate hydratase [Clostridium sp. HV4-5-A1G]KAA8674846.1 class II fumarate hydratase [Clostridium sp. HV4-5-A1G]
MEYRIEKDTMGEVKVLSDKLWGAQTQRSFENFKISTEKMPIEVIRAFSILKKGAAKANNRLGKLDDEKMKVIQQVCDEIYEGKLDDNFPLVVWQTGSGTQSNMNVNEVIANRANQILGKKLIHPNDDVNMSQSSNDTFPTAMHIAAVVEIENKLLPAVDILKGTMEHLETENRGVIKTGRTHLQDAVPIAFSQEISGWKQMLIKGEKNIKQSIEGLRELALGGTAVGTGLNAPPDFGKIAAEEISNYLGTNFVTAENKFHALTSRDDLVYAHGAMKSLAADLMKIANDVRWYASGPRCGLGEITIPENEPGSSIMPGKVNPTQCEAVTMVACQVMANDTAISFGASQGNFQLNVFMPMCIYNFLQSVRLLSDVIISFNNNCAAGIKPNVNKMKENLDKSLMLVTALNPYIGYDKSAEIAKLAHKKGIRLKDAAAELGYLTEEQFDHIIKPENMV